MIGLDISDYSVEALELRRRWFCFPILNYQRKIISPKDKLSEVLRQLTKNFASRKVNLSLPEEKVFVGTLEVKEEEIKNHLSKIIPFEEKEINYAYLARGTNEFFVAAVPKKIVNNYIEVINQAGLDLHALDMESISSARAVLDKINNINLLVDIGARTTNVNFFDEKGLFASFNIFIAGQKFTQAIGSEEKKLKGAFSPKIIQPYLESIVGEIKKGIAAYAQEEVEKMILLGGSANLKGLLEFFRANFSFPVEIGRPLQKIRSGGKIKDIKEEVLFANVVGLALREERRYKKTAINFLNRV